MTSERAALSRPRLFSFRAPQSPDRQCRTGRGCIVSRSPVRRQPEQMRRYQSPPENNLADRRMAGRHFGRMVRGLRSGSRPALRLASATSFAATVHPRRSPADCAFRFGKPMLAVWRIASIAPTLNARIHICQISLRPIARTALTHGLVNGFGWQRTAAPLAPCCNGAAQSFFPWAAPIPRGTKKLRSAPSSTALRPCGCSRASPCL